MKYKKEVRTLMEISAIAYLKRLKLYKSYKSIFK